MPMTVLVPIFARALRALPLALGLVAVTTSVAQAATTDLTVWGVSSDHQNGAVVGDTITYSFDVRNQGPDASAVTFTDQLGDGETLVSASTDQGTCTQAPPATCQLNELAAGAAVTVTVTTKVTQATTVKHSGTVSAPAGTTDTFPDDDSNFAAVVVDAPPQRQAPYVQTTFAADENQVSLDLGGKVAPYGTGAVYFEYGRTKSYGEKTTAKSLDTMKLVNVSGLAGGLKMDTIYHYRTVLVVDGKTYRGKDATAKTAGKFDALDLTLTSKALSPSQTIYSGKLKKSRIVDNPIACSGRVAIEFYPDSGADFMVKSTQLHRDCTYSIRVAFGVATARQHGPKGKVYVQASFEGNAAVNRLGSHALRP
ncbi:MAG: hypothetical protein QOF12_167 [Solirubrobacteraceae bacterium]|jgi:uncharacterized repeat protein (TIGR01451 family)|nr:hypothetical protein [Solirubrobacteraceae bacterium]